RGAAARVRRAVRPDGASGRGQHREQLTRTAQCKLFGTAHSLIKRIDARTGRAAVAVLDHRHNRRGRTGEDRFHRSVAPVAYETFETARERGVLGPGAKADALYAPADQHAADHTVACEHAAHP